MAETIMNRMNKWVFFISILLLWGGVTINATAQPLDTTCACADSAALRPLNDVLACFNDPRCETQKYDLAVALRVKGRNLAEAVKNYIALTNNASLSQVERKNYLDRIIEDRKRLTIIKKAILFEGYDSIIEPLFLDFDTVEKRYYRHYNSFNIGYEYVGLDKLVQKGVPRVGFLHYRRFGETPYTQDGLGYYGIHAFGSMQFSSSAEQTAITDTDNEIQNTLIVSLSVFVPFFHSTINFDRSLSDLTGILVTYGAKKNNAQEQVDSRVYFGLRNAFNPETYIDATFGYTQGLSTSRIEIKAHLPVYRFSHGSRIFFGGTLNMSAPWNIASTDPDVIRFYLEWNADFEKIVEGVQAAVGL